MENGKWKMVDGRWKLGFLSVSPKWRTRPRLLGGLLSFILLTGIANAQFTDSIAVTIDSAGVNSSVADLDGEKFIGVGFPTTVTSDTVFVQTRQSTTGAWKNVYYTNTSNAKVRLIILVDAADIVTVHPDQAIGVLRYVRIVSDDAEADDRTFNIYKGTY